jgi:hypothetical protein
MTNKLVRLAEIDVDILRVWIWIGTGWTFADCMASEQTVSIQLLHFDSRKVCY